MRKEFEQFYAGRPSSRRVCRVFATAVSRAYIAAVSALVFCWFKPGSPAWHRVQARLARRSATPHDMFLRGEFYRKTLPCHPRELRVYPNVFLHYPWRIVLGDRIVLNRGSLISAPARITIGRDVLVGPYCVINSGDHRFEDISRSIRGQGHQLTPIEIGEGAWLGAHVVVLRGVAVGPGAVVAAGAVVTRNVESMAVVAGVPATMIGSRLASGGVERLE